MHKLEYYFDFLSPYSYFSWKNKDQFLKNQDILIDLKPVVMGSLFNKHEMKGPGEIPAKRYYMLKQCFIYASLNNISFNPPKNHPFNPLYALRLATRSCAGERQSEVIDLLMKSCWEDGIELGEPEVLIEILNKNNFDGKDLIEKTFSKEVKQELKQNIKSALEDNCFGVPSFVVNHEVFWGNDSIPTLNLYLEGKINNWNNELFETRIHGTL